MFEVCNRYWTCGKYGTHYLPLMDIWRALHALQTYDGIIFLAMSAVLDIEWPCENVLYIPLSVEHILFIDDYLGQVIVPLSTVNRDQTCRLILPVLPKSSKSEHSKGDITLEVRRPATRHYHSATVHGNYMMILSTTRRVFQCLPWGSSRRYLCYQLVVFFQVIL